MGPGMSLSQTPAGEEADAGTTHSAAYTTHPTTHANTLLAIVAGGHIKRKHEAQHIVKLYNAERWQRGSPPPGIFFNL
jgi:hypothetical protein